MVDARDDENQGTAGAPEPVADQAPTDASAPTGGTAPADDRERPDAWAPTADPADAPEPASAAVPSGPDASAKPPVPSEAELAATAQDAYVRHAPKIGAFIVAGVVLGALVGLVLALVAGPDSPVASDGTAFISVLDGQGVVRFVMALAGALVGGLVGAALAVVADRRSVRGRPQTPADRPQPRRRPGR